MLVMTGLGISNGRKIILKLRNLLAWKAIIRYFELPSEVMPSIFIGVFMGFGVSFVGLISVEMLGVKTSLE